MGTKEIHKFSSNVIKTSLAYFPLSATPEAQHWSSCVTAPGYECNGPWPELGCRPRACLESSCDFVYSGFILQWTSLGLYSDQERWTWHGSKGELNLIWKGICKRYICRPREWISLQHPCSVPVVMAKCNHQFWLTFLQGSKSDYSIWWNGLIHIRFPWG